MRPPGDHDPSKIAWSATLPIELALKTATPQELRIHYGYSEEEWDALRENPVFMAELTAACELVRQDGMPFKLKCKLQVRGAAGDQLAADPRPVERGPGRGQGEADGGDLAHGRVRQ
jgi:hypothetical protein